MRKRFPSQGWELASLAMLVARPAREHADFESRELDWHQPIHRDAERSDPSETSENESYRSW
jgi:hypothetical protein